MTDIEALIRLHEAQIAELKRCQQTTKIQRAVSYTGDSLSQTARVLQAFVDRQRDKLTFQEIVSYAANFRGGRPVNERSLLAVMQKMARDGVLLRFTDGFWGKTDQILHQPKGSSPQSLVTRPPQAQHSYRQPFTAQIAAKTKRLKALEDMLAKAGRTGVSKTEIGRTLDVSLTTVNRDVADLIRQGQAERVILKAEETGLPIASRVFTKGQSPFKSSVVDLFRDKEAAATFKEITGQDIRIVPMKPRSKTETVREAVTEAVGPALINDRFYEALRWKTAQILYRRTGLSRSPLGFDDLILSLKKNPQNETDREVIKKALDSLIQAGWARSTGDAFEAGDDHYRDVILS